MKKIATIVIAGFFFFFLPNFSNAQDSTAKKADRRKVMKERWQNATPEQKEKAKEKAKDAKAKYDSLSPEQQNKVKEKIKQRRATQKG